MKLLQFLLIIQLGFGTFSHVLGQCENGTNTNPNTPMPSQAGFKTNTFDWRQNPIPYTEKIGMTQILYNPFFSNQSNLRPLRGGFDSDSKHEDGWELIKQDFGYAYKNGNWQGQTIFNSIGFNNETVAYMMLYNRYTTTLRIIPNLELSRVPINSQIVVILKMLKPNPSDPIYAELKFSALFNQYNKVQRALDQKSTVVEVTALAQSQSSRQGFTFVDFKLSYDPCICFFESAFNVEFQVKTKSTLVLQGRILGNTTDVADKNADPGRDFLTSVLNQDIPDQPYNQTFYSEELMKTRIAQAANQPEDNLKTIFSYIKDGAKLTKTGKELPLAMLATAAKAVVPYLEFASVLIDVSKPTESKIQSPTIITADLLAKGEVFSTTVLPGQEMILGVPGSKNASLLPEYPPSSRNGIKPMYPMYNEIPGHFAVLRTPTLHYNYEIHKNPEFEFGGETIKFISKLPDNIDLSYALGHLVNVPKTQIFVGIEVYDGNQAYVSSFLPLAQAKNLYSIMEFTWLYDNNKQSDLVYGMPFSKKDVKLVFQIFYDFKPDALGNSKTGYDLIKVKVNPVLEPNNHYMTDPRYRVYASAPTNLVMGETTVTNGNTLFSFGDIRITGNITNTGSTPLIIIAQGEVNIDPNVQLIGNIEIRSNQLFPPGVTPVYSHTPPMTASAIQAFCQKSEYKANESLPPVRASESFVSEPASNRSNLDLVVSPNPFQDELRVRFELSETDYVKLTLVNGLGQVVQTGLEETREKGVYEEILVTNDLATGIYYLTLQTKQGIQTKKMVKQL